MPTLRLLFCFFLFSSILYAQKDLAPNSEEKQSYHKQQVITKDNLEKYLEDDAFNYEVKTNEDSLYAKLKLWFYNLLNKLSVWLFGVGVAGGILATILSTIPFVLLAILIFLLIRFFLKVNSKNIIYGEQNKPIIAFTDEEQIIKNEDINALIAEAVKQNNFRLAIRYYYLLALKKLAEKDIIVWEQQKTNDDYKKEIKPKTMQSQFGKITRIYDYVWYGEFDIDAPKFENLKRDFINLNKQVSN